MTAIVIGTSGLSAETADKSVSVSIPDAGAKKGIIVVETTPPVERATAAQTIRPATSTAGYSDTIVYASGAKNNYTVDEPIHIKLKLKRKAYIYFWTISANGKGYLILPNDLESFNTYKAKTNYVVPERSADYDFVSDRAGVEQVYVLATDKKIKLSKIKSIFQNRQATNKDIKKFVTKDIKVIARTQKLKYDIASFQIQVHDKQPTPANINITINQ